MRSRTASTTIAGLLLIGVSGSAQARVTGITFEPESPVVGNSLTAIATNDQKHEVAGWAWTCTLTDAGTGNPTTIKPTVPGRATLNPMTGGTYTVSLRVTYGGPMPPPPETVSVPLVIARPDDLRLIKGFDTPALYGGEGYLFKIRSRIRSRGTDTGEHLLGMAQRRIRKRTWWDGRKDPDEPWRPEYPGPMLNHSHGVIESWATLNINPGDWAKVRPGSPIVSWDEDLRLVYGIGPVWHEGKRPHLGGGQWVRVECPLGTEHLSIIKVDDDHLAVREGVQAEAGGP